MTARCRSCGCDLQPWESEFCEGCGPLFLLAMKGEPMSRHHKSNLGKFGEQLETDLQGYTYTTVGEWLTAADLDYATARDINEDPEWAAEWATEQAAAACAALDAANAAVEDWQVQR